MNKIVSLCMLFLMIAFPVVGLVVLLICASWLSLLTFVMMLLLCYIMYTILKDDSVEDLKEGIDYLFGKKGGIDE